MKIFTATPMPFFKEGVPEDQFFSRDTGLLCREFQREGHESRVVMFDGLNVQNHPDIIRVSLEEMESAEFWAQLRLDAVVLYAWMLPCYLKIAQAIHASGTQLISRCDSVGLYDPRIDCFEYVRQEFYGYGSSVLTKNNFQRVLRAGLKTVVRLISRSYQKGVVAFAHSCDSILIESSVAQNRVQRFFRLYNRPDLAEKVQFVPHAIDVPEGGVSLDDKEKLIVAVGRWDDIIKNGSLLIRTLVCVLEQHPEYRAVVIGAGTEKIKKRLEPAGSDVRDRIEFTGRIPHVEVSDWMRKAQIILVTSRYESFNMAAAEALCMGASVVGSAHLPSIRDFVSRNSGTLADQYRTDALTKALEKEIHEWDCGRRNPSRIAGFWRERLCVGVLAQEWVGL